MKSMRKSKQLMSITHLNIHCPQHNKLKIQIPLMQISVNQLKNIETGLKLIRQNGGANFMNEKIKIISNPYSDTVTAIHSPNFSCKFLPDY